MKPYDVDLAYVHDVGFGFHADGAAPALLQLLRQRGIDDGLIIDLGCGGGSWAARLVKQGYDVLGIDISPAMINLAMGRVPKASFRVGSFLEVPLPPCDGVTALGEVLGYRFDAHNTGRPALRRIFRRVFDALLPGGLFIFDLAEVGRGRGPAERFFQGEDWAMMTRYAEDRRRHTLTREITTFRRVGNHYRRSDERHVLNLYRSAEIARALRRTGFRARIVRSYGELRFPRGLVGFVARKP